MENFVAYGIKPCASDIAFEHSHPILGQTRMNGQNPTGFKIRSTAVAAKNRRTGLLAQEMASRWRQLCHVIAITVLFTMVACGGQVSGSSNPLPVKVALQPSQPTNNEKALDANLLDLNQTWQSWAGDLAAVRYDANSEQLLIPASDAGTDLVIAVSRFVLPLTEGRQYNFSANGSHPDVAITPFLFDTNGAIVPFPGAGNLLPTAHAGADLSFIAPAGVAGFFLQIQNYWQAGEVATLNATLTGTTGDPSSGDELVSPSGPWLNWSGQASTIRYDTSRQRVVIPAPENGTGNRLGVQRFTGSLVAGSTYELSLEQSSAPAGSVLLFLFDTEFRIIPFADPLSGNNVSWLQATAENSQRFTAPAGTAGFAIQIQSDWDSVSVTSMLPSLRQR